MATRMGREQKRGFKLKWVYSKNWGIAMLSRGTRGFSRM
jgi:hypothetical protein